MYGYIKILSIIWIPTILMGYLIWKGLDFLNKL